MKQLILLDVCTPDYFADHDLPIISVHIEDDSMTVEKLIDEIEKEYNFFFDLYEEQYSGHAFDAAIAELREKNKEVLGLPFLLNPEDVNNQEGGDNLFAHFVLGNTNANYSGYSFGIQHNFIQ